jgi:hypothetical protein
MKKIILILYTAIILSIGLAAGAMFNRQRIVGCNKDYSTFVTAAHIPKSQFKNSEILYKDEIKDIAIYRNTKYKIKSPNVGEKILINDSVSGEVSYVDGDNGFIVRVDDYNEIVYGLSGTSVKDKSGTYYGFVSYLYGKSEIYCISY